MLIDECLRQLDNARRDWALRGQEMARLSRRVYSQRKHIRVQRETIRQAVHALDMAQRLHVQDTHHMGTYRVQAERMEKEFLRLRAENRRLLDRNLELEVLHNILEGPDGKV